MWYLRHFKLEHIRILVPNFSTDYGEQNLSLQKLYFFLKMCPSIKFIIFVENKTKNISISKEETNIWKNIENKNISIIFCSSNDLDRTIKLCLI